MRPSTKQFDPNFLDDFQFLKEFLITGTNISFNNLLTPTTNNY